MKIQRSNIKTTKLIGTISAASLLALAACSGGGEPDELFKMTQISGDDSFSATIAWQTSVPETMGFFEEEGLEVGIEGVKSGADTVIQAGQGEAYQASGPLLWKLTGPDQDDLVVPFVNYGHSFRITTPKSSGISSVSDLRGRTLGSTTLNAPMYLYGTGVLAEAGVDPEEDVEWLPVGNGTQAAAAFENGDIEAYAGADFYNGLIADILEQEFVEVDTPADDLTGFGGWVFRRDFVEANPDQVAGFIRATIKGLIFTATNPEAALKIHWDMFPESKPADAESQDTLDFWSEMIKLRLEMAYGATDLEREYGYAELDDIADGIEFQLANGLLEERPDLETVLMFDLVSDYNDFDRNDIIDMAKQY